MNVEIEYCLPCGFKFRADELKGNLEKDFGSKVQVHLKAGEHGIFDIKLDGKEIFSRKKEGRFPDSAEITEKLK